MICDCIEAGTLLEGFRSVYCIVMVLYLDIWREFFGGVPTSTTILGGKRDITRGKCLDFSVFIEIMEVYTSFYGNNSINQENNDPELNE